MALDPIKNYYNKESKGHPDVLDPSKLTIYGNIVCPFNSRVLIALAVKNIEYNFIGIDLTSKPDWYLSLNPNGKVPYLKHGDKTLIESLVIVNYLDDAYPSPPIHPSDAYDKAKGSLLVDELFTLVLVPIKCLKDTQSPLDKKNETINAALADLDSIYGRRKTKYLQADQPLYSDYMIWPFLNMIVPLCLSLNHPEIKSIQSIASLYPSLGKYLEAMQEDSIAKKILPPIELLKAYYDKNYSK